jgi:hypothetical protein
MMFKGIAKSTPFARYWFSWVAGIELDIDLGVACSGGGSSLNRLEVTRHLTMGESE